MVRREVGPVCPKGDEAAKRPLRGRQEATTRPPRGHCEAAKRPLWGRQEASLRPPRGRFEAVKRPLWGRQEASFGPTRGRSHLSEEGQGQQETVESPSVLPRPQCKIYVLFLSRTSSTQRLELGRGQQLKLKSRARVKSSMCRPSPTSPCRAGWDGDPPTSIIVMFSSFTWAKRFKRNFCLEN